MQMQSKMHSYQVLHLQLKLQGELLMSSFHTRLPIVQLHPSRLQCLIHYNTLFCYISLYVSSKVGNPEIPNMISPFRLSLLGNGFALLNISAVNRQKDLNHSLAKGSIYIQNLFSSLPFSFLNRAVKCMFTLIVQF